MRLYKFNLIGLVVVLIILLPFNIMLDFSLKEVNQVTKYFVQKEFDSFIFVRPVEEQLKSSPYDQNTTLALHYLASINYDYRWAKDNVSQISEYDLVLNKHEINSRLESICSKIIFKCHVIGYGIILIKWSIIIILFEGIKTFSMRIFNKVMKKLTRKKEIGDC